jgi:hypothetical protein
MRRDARVHCTISACPYALQDQGNFATTSAQNGRALEPWRSPPSVLLSTALSAGGVSSRGRPSVVTDSFVLPRGTKLRVFLHASLFFCSGGERNRLRKRSRRPGPHIAREALGPPLPYCYSEAWDRGSWAILEGAAMGQLADLLFQGEPANEIRYTRTNRCRSIEPPCRRASPIVVGTGTQAVHFSLAQQPSRRARQAAMCGCACGDRRAHGHNLLVSLLMCWKRQK